jgi:hypothetical protein
MKTIQDIKNELKIALDDYHTHITTGQKLIKAFKLQKFKYIWIQRVIDSSLPIWIISVDSRRPTVYFSMSKLRHLDSTIIRRLKKRGPNSVLLKKPNLSIPIPLQHFDNKFSSNVIIIRRDIGGEYFMNKDYYTESIKKLKISLVI